MSEEELNAIARLDPLKSVIAGAMRRIQHKVDRAVTSNNPSQLFWVKQLNSIEGEYGMIMAAWRRSAPAMIRDGFTEGAISTRRVLRAFTSVRETKTQPDTLAAMIDDTILRMAQATEGGQAMVQTLFRRTRQRVLTEIEINERLAIGLIDGTPQSIKTELEDAIRARIANGQLLEVVGENRTTYWRPDKYAELVARTRVREAQTAGAIAQVREAGLDLVQVSSHQTDTELCQQFEGNVYSISGESQTYPQLEESPPFHPNCQHVLVPFVE